MDNIRKFIEIEIKCKYDEKERTRKETFDFLSVESGKWEGTS